ncbi:MAG: WD40/YVTN/BNR-like repeat-containing protein, partial [Candidatus Methylomirabilales bacterium]
MKLSFLKRSFWLLIVVWMSTPSAGRPIAASAVGDLTFGSAGLHGGGHQNVTAVAAGSSTVLSGADVSGVNRSANLGLVYAPSNLGLTTLKVASLAYHPSVAGRLYAATGNEGRSGGFYRSNDDGRSWELLSEVPKFSGNHAPSNPAVPENHPRSTGNLIAIDAASGIIWVGTFKDGVMRSTDGGRTWETLGL